MKSKILTNFSHPQTLSWMAQRRSRPPQTTSLGTGALNAWRHLFSTTRAEQRRQLDRWVFNLPTGPLARTFLITGYVQQEIGTSYKTELAEDAWL